MFNGRRNINERTTSRKATTKSMKESNTIKIQARRLSGDQFSTTVAQHSGAFFFVTVIREIYYSSHHGTSGHKAFEVVGKGIQAKHPKLKNGLRETRRQFIDFPSSFIWPPLNNIFCVAEMKNLKPL